MGILKSCYTSGEKFNKSMRFFASLRMTNKVILPLTLINQPFPYHSEVGEESHIFLFKSKNQKRDTWT
jgi:hypothetical protein